MEKKLLTLIGGAIVASVFWLPANVYAWGGTLTITFNSIHCSDTITGGTNQQVNSGAASCAINVKEIAWKCVNKAGNADTSSSHIFAVNQVPISSAQPGAQWVQKNGKQLSDIFFSAAEIAAATGFNPDPAVVCPNKNWQVVWGVTKADMVATVDNVTEGWLPVYPSLDQATAFNACDPAISQLTFTDGTNTDPTKGIMQECWLFRNRHFVDASFDGTDLGGIKLLDPNFTPQAFYNGVCEAHGGVSGSLGNPGSYKQVGPSPSDAECTGSDTVLDGSY